MSLRIAFDMDGVLADMDGALVRQAEAVFGEEFARRLRQPQVAARPSEGAPDPAGSDEPSDSQEQQAGSSNGADGTPEAKLSMTPRQERSLWRHVRTVENFWESLE